MSRFAQSRDYWRVQPVPRRVGEHLNRGRRRPSRLVNTVVFQSIRMSQVTEPSSEPKFRESHRSQARRRGQITSKNSQKCLKNPQIKSKKAVSDLFTNAQVRMTWSQVTRPSELIEILEYLSLMREQTYFVHRPRALSPQSQHIRHKVLHTSMFTEERIPEKRNTVLCCGALGP